MGAEGKKEVRSQRPSRPLVSRRSRAVSKRTRVSSKGSSEASKGNERRESTCGIGASRERGREGRGKGDGSGGVDNEERDEVEFDRASACGATTW